MGQALEHEAWAEEKEMPEEERRKRYRCKPEQLISCLELDTWDKVVDDAYERSVARQKEKARDDEKHRRKEIYVAERKKQLEEERQKAKKQESGDEGSDKEQKSDDDGKKKKSKGKANEDTDDDKDTGKGKEKQGEKSKGSDKPAEKGSKGSDNKGGKPASPPQKRAMGGGQAHRKPPKPQPPAKCITTPGWKYYKCYEHDPALNQKIAHVRADITRLEIEAVVNAANKSLLGGGGIDGVIHRAAGPRLLEECKDLNGAETGETKITRGYNLPAHYILHTVGPVVGGKLNILDEKHLVKCYEGCLDMCVTYQLRSVALCGVSTGIYGYPPHYATHLALHTVRTWLASSPLFSGPKAAKLDLVLFCTYLESEEKCYEELLAVYFPPEGKNSDDVLAAYKESYDSYDPAEEDEELDEEVEQEVKEEEEKRKKEEEERRKFHERMRAKMAEEERQRKEKEAEDARRKKKKKQQPSDDEEGEDENDDEEEGNNSEEAEGESEEEEKPKQKSKKKGGK